MKNMLGDECKPRRLTIRPEGDVLTLLRNNRFVGYVARNGWNGKSRSIDYALGVPVLRLSTGSEEFSLSEMKRIMAACKRLPRRKT